MTDLISRQAAIDARCPDIFAEMVWRGHDSQGQSIIFERSKGMKLRTKLKRAKEENEWLRGQLLMQYMNPGKVCCFDRKRVERVERVKLRNVRRIRTDDLPSAEPTLYGYKIEHLAYIARVMEKEGITAEDAARTFSDLGRAVSWTIDEALQKLEEAVRT